MGGGSSSHTITLDQLYDPATRRELAMQATHAGHLHSAEGYPLAPADIEAVLSRLASSNCTDVLGEATAAKAQETVDFQHSLTAFAPVQQDTEVVTADDHVTRYMASYRAALLQANQKNIALAEAEARVKHVTGPAEKARRTANSAQSAFNELKRTHELRYKEVEDTRELLAEARVAIDEATDARKPMLMARADSLEASLAKAEVRSSDSLAQAETARECRDNTAALNEKAAAALRQAKTLWETATAEIEAAGVDIARGHLRTAVDKLRQALIHAIDTRLDCNAWVRQCDGVISDGDVLLRRLNEDIGVPNSSSRVVYDTFQRQCRKRLGAMYDRPCQQHGGAKDPVVLYRDAMQAKPHANELVERVRAVAQLIARSDLCSHELKPMVRIAHSHQEHLLATVIHMRVCVLVQVRTLEQSLLDPDRIGSTQVR